MVTLASPTASAFLNGTASIAGTVTTSLGDPVANANVVLSDLGSGESTSVVTAADGSYRIDLLEPSEYLVDVSPPDGVNLLSGSFVGVSGSAIAVGEAETVTGIDVQLEVGGIITGRVTDTDGSPISGASVLILSLWRTVTTGVDGSYSIDRLATGDLTLAAGSSGYSTVFYPGASSIALASPVSVNAGSTTPDIDFQLAPAAPATIRGVVSDVDGNPLEGAFVYISVLSGDPFSSTDSVLTDVSGSYTISNIPSGTVMVSVSLSGYAQILGSEVDLPPGSDTVYNLTMVSASAEIAGVVTNSDGEPLDANVLAESTDGLYSGQAQTDPLTGAYIIAGLPDSEYTVYATPRNRSAYLPRYFPSARYQFDATAVVASGSAAGSGTDIVLPRASSLSGRVTDKNDMPIEGVSVAVNYDGVATTDSNGDWFAGGLEAGFYIVSFTPPEGLGFLTKWYPNETDPDLATPIEVTEGGSVAGIDVMLSSLPSISGTVTGPGGEPVEGATVVALGFGSYGIATTAPDGSYVVTGLDSGLYCVKVEPPSSEPGLAGSFGGTNPDYCDEFSGGAVDLATGDANGVDIQLDIGGTISGRVTDADGQPVESVTVTASDAFGERSAMTDADGNYTVRGLGTSWTSVQFAPLDESPFLVQYWPARARPIWNVYVVRGQDLVGIDTQLRSAARIDGTVVDESGDPVEGAEVRLEGVTTGGWETAVTDSTGFYSFPKVFPSTRIVLSATANGYLQTYHPNAPTRGAADLIGVDDGSSTVLAPLVLRASGAIEGTVTGPDGSPVAGVNVLVFRRTDAAWLDLTGWTDIDGTYRVSGLEVGDYTVRFLPPSESLLAPEWLDGHYAGGPAASVTLTSLTTLTGVDVQLSAGGTLTGTITGWTGEPASAFVQLISKSDPQFCSGSYQCYAFAPSGSFSFSALPPGEYTYQAAPFDFGFHPVFAGGAFSPDLASTVVVNDGEVATLDTQFPLGGVLEGVVRNADGSPAPGVTVYVTSAIEFAWQRATTGVDGSFRISGIASGSRLVYLYNPESGLSFYYPRAGAQEAAVPVTFAEGATTTLDIELIAPATISGRVTDQNGNPVADAMVFPFGPWTEGYLTDTDGRYTISGLAPGQISLEVRPPAGSTAATTFFPSTADPASAVEIAVAAGASITADVQLIAGGTISGVVTDGSDPVENVCIAIHGRSDYEANETLRLGCAGYTDSEGRYTLTNLAPGTYPVCAVPDREILGVRCFGDALAPQDSGIVLVSAGVETTDVDLVLEPSGSITGVLVGADGNLMIGSVVEAYAAGSPNPESAQTLGTAITDVTGGFRIDGLTPGTYAIRVAGLVAVATGIEVNSRDDTHVVVAEAQAPGAPTSVGGTTGNGQVSLTWVAPSNNGGAPVTDYRIEYSVDGTTWTPFSDGVSAAVGSTVTGLVNGTEYQFRIAAVNVAGIGAWSSASAGVTPRTVPGRPGTPTGKPGNARIVLSWNAPVSDGGSPIIDYVVQYSGDSGSTWKTFSDGISTATSVTVTGLVNGRSYVVKVAAKNVAGRGVFSLRSTSVTPRTVPNAPRTPTVTTLGGGKVRLTWAEPFDGGSPIVDYVVQYSTDRGTTWRTWSDGVRDATAATLTLPIGRYVNFRVAAKNIVGRGPFSAATVRYYIR